MMFSTALALKRVSGSILYVFSSGVTGRRGRSLKGEGGVGGAWVSGEGRSGERHERGRRQARRPGGTCLVGEGEAGVAKKEERASQRESSSDACRQN